MQVCAIPRSHGILKGIMQLAEGIPGRDVERAFDNGVGGADKGEVECISIPVRKKKNKRKKVRFKALERLLVQHRHTPPAIFLMKFPILSNQNKHYKIS
jgi:hypothetical protein